METYKEIYEHKITEDNEEGLLVKWLYKGKEEFNTGAALTVLLLQQKVFVNARWYEDKWPEDAKKMISINVLCNDVFEWACADAEGLQYNELKDLFDHYEKDPQWGTAIWCIKKRGGLPQKPVYDAIQAAGIWDLDEMNLKNNISKRGE